MISKTIDEEEEAKKNLWGLLLLKQIRIETGLQRSQ